MQPTPDTSPSAQTLAPRRLGRAGFNVRPFGLGTASLGSDRASDDQAVATVRRALELGIDFIGTSPLYGMGESERRIGLALSPEARRGIRLQTKAGTGTQPKAYDGDSIRRSGRSSRCSRTRLAPVRMPPMLRSPAETRSARCTGFRWR